MLAGLFSVNGLQVNAGTSGSDVDEWTKISVAEAFGSDPAILTTASKSTHATLDKTELEYTTTYRGQRLRT